MAARRMFWAFSLAAACTGSYVYGPVNVSPTTPKAADCGFEVTETVPRRPFEELGILSPKDIEYGDMAGGSQSFFESVREQVCAVGGDAVVVERGAFGRYVRGTVVKFK